MKNKSKKDINYLLYLGRKTLTKHEENSFFSNTAYCIDLYGL